MWEEYDQGSRGEQFGGTGFDNVKIVTHSASSLQRPPDPPGDEEQEAGPAKPLGESHGQSWL